MATIVGTPGDDHIAGTAKADVIVGGGGTDRIGGKSGDDIICGGPSGVRVIIEPAENVPQSLFGGPGNDVIVGGPQGDALSDPRGEDVLLGRGGGDLLSTDSFRRGDDDVLRGGPGPDQLTSSRGDDELYGGKGEDLLEDWLGNNVLRGGGGNDTLGSGSGNDAIYGGPGVDRGEYALVLDSSIPASNCPDVMVDLSRGVASGTHFGADTLTGVENIKSGSGEDVLIGDSRNNTFYAGKPCHPTEEAAQRDSVAGGDGWDRILFDSHLWDGNTPLGPVAVDLAAGTAVQPNSGPSDVVVTVVLDSIENVTGTRGRDTIVGDDRPNRLSGGLRGCCEGDVIRGRGGNDYLVGSEGSDTIYGDEGADKLRGRWGNDRLDGGLDVNIVDGGRGEDSCQNPDRYNGALNCEM
ncbi:calcium-binding protein [Nocardioides sp. GCM10028917]|uniref:calcium-binding protein n=1 Tax=Nocardioides sp. GCM10028917 TaxID=3273408 RepID=UPI003610F534